MKGMLQQSSLLKCMMTTGLYDSIPLEPLVEQTLETAAEGIFWDEAFAKEMLSNIAAIGFEVEKAFGGEPQDIEGVWRGGKITIVQARPQIL